ncbi:MAG: flagellar basal-body rod protein FlgC [Dactylosporangium sp.]|nr:flagellar basal-body rod protein FlgC [Dactylosporangium sp.]NNJ61982.1 flagellar basal-body rod protein FlgC [Dactylosporangium sp.]
MTIFSALGVASTGITVHRKWMDAVSDNITNINTAKPTSEDAFEARYVIAEAVDYGTEFNGVQVGGTVLSGKTEGRLVYDPGHPLADVEGYVRMPDIDLGSQMTQLMMAQRGYQANLSVADRAQGAYQAAIQLGRNT